MSIGVYCFPYGSAFNAGNFMLGGSDIAYLDALVIVVVPAPVEWIPFAAAFHSTHHDLPT